ncbi:hypothetical protein GGS23DRAFT_549926 [Durotheca rogersii]|uniref:uncharacterized protein n=1 Tax=Durotheca rogersii TaxID=419775 RepID=UPI00221F6550|nr:uncharacterized protein GGS23DRAFT_549926 [Durotheca rogersii]KAI5867785.1 hypothetical protein GGS23DRAFT_549926 [Durotheca rogersii]
MQRRYDWQSPLLFFCFFLCFSTRASPRTPTGGMYILCRYICLPLLIPRSMNAYLPPLPTSGRGRTEYVGDTRETHRVER